MSPSRSFRSQSVDDRLQQLGEVFGIIGESYVGAIRASTKDRPPVEVNREKVQAAGDRLIETSQVFLKELDVRAARAYLNEINSAINMDPLDSGPTITITVTVTVTVTATHQNVNAMIEANPVSQVE
jgi:hypothetical protein